VAIIPYFAQFFKEHLVLLDVPYFPGAPGEGRRPSPSAARSGAP
jgi:hypothetical protein